jgi:hypothetical protein
MFSQATTRSFCYIFLKDCGWLEEKLVPAIEDFLLLCDSLTWPLLNVLGHLQWKIVLGSTRYGH